MEDDIPPFPQEERFHELLIKDCRGTLTPEEQIEYNRLSEEREAPINAAEAERCAKVTKDIEILKKLLERFDEQKSENEKRNSNK